MARHSTAEDKPAHFEAQIQFWKAVQGRIPTATGRLRVQVTFLQSRTGISGFLQEVSSSPPNPFLTDVSTCSFTPAAAQCPVLLPSWMAVCSAQACMEKRICRQQTFFSQLAGDFGGCHSQCVGGTLLPITSPLHLSPSHPSLVLF